MWTNLQFPVDLATVTEQIFNGKLNFLCSGESKSIEKSMIPYQGNHRSRQQINSKPVQMGYNIWVLAEAYNYEVQFEPYQGVKKGK